MAERELVILKYVDKTPSLAMCAKCGRRFFTLNIYYHEVVAAEGYLRDKFDRHDCQHELQKAAPAVRR